MWTKYLSHVGNHLGEKRKALPPARKIACVNWFNSRKDGISAQNCRVGIGIALSIKRERMLGTTDSNGVQLSNTLRR